MNTSPFRYLILAFIFTTPLVAYATTELQVACKGKDEDAAVTINDELKGYCPVLLEVKPGTLKLRVVKKVDALHERVFEKEILLGDDERKKVDVVTTIQEIVAGQSQDVGQARKSVEATMLSFKEQGVEPGNGKSFKDCKNCPEMVLVPPGSFMMGAPSSQKQQTISQTFAVGKYEVTFAEWDACAAEGGCGKYRPDDQGWGRGRQPVINVSWSDARQYVRWLSQKTGNSYRLLTEVEWEYAARAGTTTAYPWGDAIGSGNANCNGCGSKWDNKQPAPVGSFKANAFGLYDMHGNVCERVEDCVNENCAMRIFRGGSWFYDPLSVSSINRGRDSIDARDIDDGFRVVRTLP